MKHPLVETARKAGIHGAERANVPRGASAAEAWSGLLAASGLDEEALARSLAPALKLEAADLARPEGAAIKLIPEKLARRHKILPLRQDDRHIVVATSDPGDLEMEQAVRFASGRNPLFALAGPRSIERMLDVLYTPDRAMSTLLSGLKQEATDDVAVVGEQEAEKLGGAELQTGPVVKLTNLVLRCAVTERASDIHLEPGREQGAVRLRIDGVMHEYMQMPMPALNRVVSRIKILGKLDISDRMRPQDGRARIRVADREYDLRISTVPTRESEKAVIRILGQGGTQSLEDLMMPPGELQRFRSLLAHRDGIVVVTGPTGSGKTTTLYSAIRSIATGEQNVMTVEDPIEYELGGITQIQVEPRRGVTFASALRAILRQDPDVIFVGEIRDAETAEIAVQASMTGHLVLATLHTNDAASVVSRLEDLGLDRSSIAATLRGALAQRLVRRACTVCARPAEGLLTPEEERLSARFAAMPVVRAQGCHKCGGTGFRGRMPVMEVLVVTPAVAERIAAGAPLADIQQAAAAAGMRGIATVAAERVTSGLTTLEEIDRVLGELPGVSAELPAASEETEVAARSGEPRVLVVDDEIVSRKLARTLLEKAGMQVVEAEDGEAALRAMRGAPSFSAIVTDLSMPGLDGRQLLHRLRESPLTASLPVIVLTASEDPAGEVRLMDEGADDYIRKPIDPARFTSRVRAALRRSGADRGA